MNQIKQLQDAMAAARSIITKYAGASAPNESRRAELKKLSKERLIELLLSIEKSSDKPFKVADLARELLESKPCEVLPYKVMAELITSAFPALNTSAASLSSYASKEDDWNVVPRKRLLG